MPTSVLPVGRLLAALQSLGADTTGAVCDSNATLTVLGSTVFVDSAGRLNVDTPTGGDGLVTDDVAKAAARIHAHAAGPVTTVRVMAMVETHPYQAGPVAQTCRHYLPNLDVVCGHDADHVFHRVEELSDDQEETLRDIYRYGAGGAGGDADMNRLYQLGFIALGGVTSRGRAWLEVHRA